MNKKITLGVFLFCTTLFYAQVGIGTTTPAAGAMLDVNGNGGILIPRITLTSTTSTEPISPPAPAVAQGVMVYNTATVSDVIPGFYYWDGSAWQRMASGTSTDWALTGNSGTVTGTNFVGTTDNQDLQFRTFNTPQLEITTAGRMRAFQNGTADTPTYSFTQSPNMGMYRVGNNEIGMATGSALRFQITNTFLRSITNHHFALGLASAPGITFDGNTNTGIFSPGANTIAFSTNGAERMRVDATGSVGIGTVAPTARLHANGTLRFTGINEGVAGRVLTADAAGNATWQTPAGGGSGWSLTGNTVASTNFLGTTNYESLYLRVNNMRIGRFHPAGGISLGFQSEATSNHSIAIGFSTETSQEAVALGHDAHASGNESVAIGKLARSLFQNIAIGLSANSIANNGIALGNSATVEAGSGNGIAIGLRASTLNNNTISIGTDSDATSQNSIAAGNLAQATGQNSTALGNGAQATGQNSTALGNGAVANANNTISIGNSAITAIRGQVNFTTYSDGRFKSNVKDEVPGLSFIEKLRPVTYKFDREKLSEFKNETVKAENLNLIESGFIAQEVEKAANEVGYSFNGINTPQNPDSEAYSLSYSLFVVPLVKAVQEQQHQIEMLKKEIAELKQLRAEITDLKEAFFSKTNAADGFPTSEARKE